MTPISEFVYRRRVQFRDTDASGLVHFSTYFVFAEEAEHAMWRSVGLTVASGGSGIAWPRVSASFEFLKPLAFEDEIDVRIRIVGRTAKTFRYQSILMRGDEMVAAGTVTAICVRKVAGQPLKAVDIPAEIVERFEVVAPEDTATRGAAPSRADSARQG